MCRMPSAQHCLVSNRVRRPPLVASAYLESLWRYAYGPCVTQTVHDTHLLKSGGSTSLAPQAYDSGQPHSKTLILHAWNGCPQNGLVDMIMHGRKSVPDITTVIQQPVEEAHGCDAYAGWSHDPVVTAYECPGQAP